MLQTMTTRTNQKKVIPVSGGAPTPAHTTGLIVPKKEPQNILKKTLPSGSMFDFNIHVTQTMVIIVGAIIVFYILKSKA